MSNETCLLCSDEVPVTNDGALSQTLAYDCPTCGKYKCTDIFKTDFSLSAKKKAQLRAVLRERQAKKYPPVILTDEESTLPHAFQVEELLNEYPRSASEMMDRALLNLGRLTEHPYDTVNLKREDRGLLFARDLNELGWLLDEILVSRGYIDSRRATPPSQCFRLLRITPEGWQKIEELQQVNIESKQAFVAMWFDEQMSEAWEIGIKPAIEDEEVGDFRALRIDLQEHNRKICDEIIAQIRRSRFLVADFTGNRGGVYYEAGFAEGLGIPVIRTVRKGSLKDVHFDTRQYNHIVYESPEELRMKLKNRIMATIPVGVP